MIYPQSLQLRQLQSPLKLRPNTFLLRQYTTNEPFPRIIGVGEQKSFTPLTPPSLPWYKTAQFRRTLVNIWLLAFFANCASMIMGYKSEFNEITWQSKERIRTLKETIQKVRNREPIDVRAALGTGNPKSEKEWAECKTFMFGGLLTRMVSVAAT
jgi:Family of unknown function (DUF5321)